MEPSGVLSKRGTNDEGPERRREGGRASQAGARPAGRGRCGSCKRRRGDRRGRTPALPPAAPRPKGGRGDSGPVRPPRGPGALGASVSPRPSRCLTWGGSRRGGRGGSALGPRCKAACCAASRSRRAASCSTKGGGGGPAGGCAFVTCSRTRRSCSGPSGATRAELPLWPGGARPPPPSSLPSSASGSASAMAADTEARTRAPARRRLKCASPGKGGWGLRVPRRPRHLGRRPHLQEHASGRGLVGPAPRLRAKDPVGFVSLSPVAGVSSFQVAPLGELPRVPRRGPGSSAPLSLASHYPEVLEVMCIRTT